MLPDNYSEFGLNTPFVVKGQRLILNYDSSIREGLGADRVVIASLEGAGLPQKKWHRVIVTDGPGWLSIPIKKPAF